MKNVALQVEFDGGTAFWLKAARGRRPEGRTSHQVPEAEGRPHSRWTHHHLSGKKKAVWEEMRAHYEPIQPFLDALKGAVNGGEAGVVTAASHDLKEKLCEATSIGITEDDASAFVREELRVLKAEMAQSVGRG